MPGEKVYPKSDDGDVTEFIKKTFEKRECNRFRREKIQTDIEFCECGYSKKVHSDEAIHNESNQSEPSTKTFRTDAFGKLDFVEDEDSDWKTKLKNIRYIRLDYKTDANKILKLFNVWKMDEAHVILSVVSNSDHSMGTGANETTGPTENIRETIRSLVETAAATNAWIITGGLNKGVDQLIGNAVKQRLANGDKIPQAVLGFSNWGCLEEKKTLLNGSSASSSSASDSKPLSLNRHHTHFLLVDDGTQKRTGCESVLRTMVELTLTKTLTNDDEKDQGRPLIYFLIGGSIDTFGFVERALANQIPVIIAKRTGGAADVISGKATSKDGPTLEYLPEITEKPFNRLSELLGDRGIAANALREVIIKIKTETKLEPFFDVVELLSQARISEGDAQQFRNDIANSKKTTTNELLAEIKDLLISKQTLSDSSNHSTTNAESDTVKRMRVVIEQMLIANGIPPDNAKQAADKLEPNVLKEMLDKTKLVYANLKAIRTPDQKGLLIHFDITGKGKKTISSLIVEALKKVKRSKQSDVYMLVADWDNEIFFRQLLLENWMRHDHENVFMKLLNKGKTKYVKLMMEHISNSSWLTTPQGPLEEDFKKNKMCAYLLKKINNPESNRDNEDTLPRMKAKMLFIWCMHRQMPEAAMLFWKQGQDCLAMALVAYHESKKQKKGLIDKEGYEKMEQQIQYFSKLALNLLRTCYADNHQNTHDLLIGKVNDLDGLTPLQIAVDANFKAFVSEAPVQKLLDKIWVKNIENYSKYKYVPILLSGACPVLAPVLFDFRIPSDDSNEEKHNGRTVKSNEFVGSYFWKFKSFIDTPLVKFFYGFLSHIGYLTLFSIVLLTDFRGITSPSEIALSVWTFILITEEIKQVIVQKSGYMNEWNYFDIGALIIYVVGFILRMIYDGDYWICPDCLYVARIVLAFSLLIFFFRTLQFLSIGETLGPKIYMLRGLISDLISFMLILAVFISAYGVVSNVILYPNQPLNGKLLQDVFYDAWWSLVLQFNREDASGLNCNEDNINDPYITAEYCSRTYDRNVDYVACKANRCPANNWIVSVLLAFYALITVIMLLNVLIAIFNTTFSTINEKQKEVSKMQRYLLIREYSSRSMVPPPLCVITYPYHIIKYLYNLCKDWLEDEDHSQTDIENKESPRYDKDKQIGKRSKPFKSPPKAFAKHLNSRVRDWEHRVVEDYNKRNKDKEEWLLARMESEKDKTGIVFETPNNFDETQMIRYILQKIRNEIREGQSSGETDPGVSRSDSSHPNSDDKQEKKKKKRKRKDSEQTSDSKA